MLSLIQNKGFNREKVKTLKKSANFSWQTQNQTLGKCSWNKIKYSRIWQWSYISNILTVLNQNLWKVFVIWNVLGCFRQCFGRLWVLHFPVLKIHKKNVFFLDTTYPQCIRQIFLMPMNICTNTHFPDNLVSF